MIEIKELRKAYKNTEVLKGINLKIDKGSIFGIAGRSGSGKSTLLRCINGIENFDNGQILVDNRDIGAFNAEEIRAFRKNIGMVFQSFSLMNRVSVYENIALPMKCWKYQKNEIDKKVKELLDIVGIPEKVDSKARDLSGGQKQRVAIARALTMNPKVLLCDEATSALDPKSTKLILNLLKEINRKLGITIIIVTHEMPVIKSICKNVAIIESGMIETVGTTDKIFAERPKALINLLGERDIILSKGERAIEFFYSYGNGQIVTKLARDLDIDFTIVDSEMNSLGEEGTNSTIIRLEDKYFNNIIKYLEEREIIWREIF